MTECLTTKCKITINQCLTIGEVMGEKAGYCCECAHDESYGDQYWCDNCKGDDEEKMTTKQIIKEYVDDHYEHLEFYPLDVEIDDRVYSWDEYWSILDDDKLK